MDKWQKVKINEFLKERPDRIKPIEANTMGLKRIEKIDFGGNIYLSEKTTNTNMILVKSGDLVISGINVEKGALAVYEGEEDVLATIHYSSYEFDKDKIDIEFLKYFLISSSFKKILIEQTGSGIKTELKPKKFLALKVLIPKIEIQKSIVKRIKKVESEISDLHKNNKYSLELIKKLRQSILQEAVEGKLTVDYRAKNEVEGKEVKTAEALLKKIKEEKEKLIAEGKIRKDKSLPPIMEEEKPFELPKNWEWVRLGEISELITDGKHGDCENETNSGYYFLSAKDIQEEELVYSNAREITEKDFLEVHRRTNLEINDICMVNTGATVGKLAIVKEKTLSSKTTFQKSVAVIKPLKRYLSSFYIKIFLKFETPRLRKKSGGSAINNLLLGDMKKMMFPLPPLAEQKKIVEKVDKLMAYCDKLENMAISAEKESEMLMQSVLKEAFEG